MSGGPVAVSPTQAGISAGGAMSQPRALRVVVATPDTVGERMAGPGIRAAWIARELCAIADVVLIARSAESSVAPLFGEPRDVKALPILIARHSPAAEAAMTDADVLIGQPARGFARRRRDQKIIYDLFDPLVLELRELYGDAPSLRQRVHLAAEWGRLVFALQDGDALISAAARQRDFYDQLRWRDVPWIDVPFGIDPREVTATRASPPDPDLAIWGGGVWEWLDPRTAVEAVLRLNAQGVSCRLLFLGRGRPNQGVVERRREDRFDALVAAGSPYVEANAEWVRYRERLSWLRKGRLAIMLHRATSEADYSIRTRLFDAIVAGVPIIATEHGFAADLVRSEQLGIVVPPADAAAVASAMRRLLTDDEFHGTCVRNLERIRPRFAWRSVTRPLIDLLSEWQKRH